MCHRKEDIVAQRKRRESGSGTITKRKDGRWEARYTSGTNPSTGKPIRHCIYGKTQKEVAAKLREVTRDIDTGSYIEPAQYTVAEWMQTYLAEYTMNLKPYALHSYEAVIRNHITPALGKIKLQALTTVQIQAFVNSLCRPSSKGGKALSPKTAKNVYGVLHRGLDLAVRIGVLRSNPANACILPKVPKPEIRTITDEQLDRFLSACKGDPFYRLYLVDLFTGMRQGEILGLSWPDIDWEHGSLYLHQQLQQYLTRGDCNCYMNTLKNGKSRTVTVAPTVLQILREQRLIQNEQRMAAGPLWYNEYDLVFTNEAGRPLNRRTVYKHLKKILSGIGLDDCYFHTLRHTFATLSLQNGDDVLTVKENLGHHSAAFTLNTYGHLTQAMRRDSAERMEKLIQTTVISKNA